MIFNAKNYMRIVLIIIILLLLMSCTNETESEINKYESEKPGLEMVQINLYGCFIYPSVFVFNISDSSILFQPSGHIIATIEPPNHENEKNEIIEVYRPKFLYFHLDSTENHFINDSIIAKFNAHDFKDSINNGFEDGGGARFIFLYSNDSIKEIEVWNAFTERQALLISKFVDLSFERAKDSLMRDYLLRLK